MNKHEIAESLADFITNEVINKLEDRIFELKENFDYSIRKDIHIVYPHIKVGENLRIQISAISEIDDFDDNHNNDIKFFIAFIKEGK